MRAKIVWWALLALSFLYAAGLSFALLTAGWLWVPGGGWGFALVGWTLFVVVAEKLYQDRAIIGQAKQALSDSAAESEALTAEWEALIAEWAEVKEARAEVKEAQAEVEAMMSNVEAMASRVEATASDVEAMTSDLKAMMRATGNLPALSALQEEIKKRVEALQIDLASAQTDLASARLSDEEKQLLLARGSYAHTDLGVETTHELRENGASWRDIEQRTDTVSYYTYMRHCKRVTGKEPITGKPGE